MTPADGASQHTSSERGQVTIAEAGALASAVAVGILALVSLIAGHRRGCGARLLIVQWIPRFVARLLRTATVVTGAVGGVRSAGTR